MRARRGILCAAVTAVALLCGAAAFAEWTEVQITTPKAAIGDYTVYVATHREGGLLKFTVTVQGIGAQKLPFADGYLTLLETGKHLLGSDKHVAPSRHTDRLAEFRFGARPGELSGSKFEFRAQGYLSETHDGRVKYHQTLGGEACWFELGEMAKAAAGRAARSSGSAQAR